MDLLDRYRNVRRIGPGRSLAGRMLFVLLAGLLFSTAVNAQQSISLEECLRIAHEQSPALIEAKRKYDIARSTAESQARSLYTKVDLTLSAPIYTDNTIPIYDPATGLTNLLPNRITQYGPGLTISQPMTWTGGTLSFSGQLYRQTQIPPSGSQVNDYLGLSTISLDQPIFKTNELALTAKEADMALEDARAEYATQWSQVNYSIENLFYSLYQAEAQLQIQQDVVTTGQSNYELAVNKFKAGLIAEVEELQLEADYAAARTDLFDKRRLCAAAQRELEIALGRPFSDSLTASLDTLPEVTTTIDPDKAVRVALDNREDMLNARQAIRYSEDQLARTENERTISASLTGTFGTSSEAQLVDLGQDQYLNLNRGLVLSINVPLFDWGAHSYKVDADESAIALDKTVLELKEQQVKQEVLSAIDQIEAAREQVQVAKQSVEVAEKAYQLSRDRFDLGKITSQDLSLDQDRLTRARLSALNAEVAEHLAFADLTQKTLFDFESGKPVVPE